MSLLQGRNFLTLLDYTSEEIQSLLDLSIKLKYEKSQKIASHTQLAGKHIVLLFEKDSTRTRCAFETAAYDLGVLCTYLGPTGTQAGKKESIADTAKVLSRMYEGIAFRGFSQRVVETLAENASVPVWNGLTDISHPTQVLADFLTLMEHKGSLQGTVLAFVGNVNSNIGNSLMIGAMKMGMDFRAVAPKGYFPHSDLVERCRHIAQDTGAKLMLTEDRDLGVKHADAIVSDVWVSMGESDAVWEQRIRDLLPYQVNAELLRHAHKDCVFLHCLPAFHDTETVVGKNIYEKFGIKEMEVSNEVFLSDRSLVFDEAENRHHTIKALILATMPV